MWDPTFTRKKTTMNIKAFGPRQARWVDERPFDGSMGGVTLVKWCLMCKDQ